MRHAWDPPKNVRNVQERKLPFERVFDFDWEHVVVWRDERKAYPETRLVALGFIGKRLHVLCFSPIEGGIRVISLRKANAREVKKYETQINH